MNRKKWALVILIIASATIYFIFFFKSYSEKNVVAGADNIIAVDVKRVANTLIWNYITTPSQWKLGSLLSSSEEVSWKDMIKIPDYIFIFHVKGQPANAWYTVFEIDDPEDFKKGLQRYEFKKSSDGLEFYSVRYQLQLIQHENKIIVGNFKVSNEWMRETAARLFNKQETASKEQLQKTIASASHFSWHFTGNQNISAAHAQLNFDKNSITIESVIALQKPAELKTNNFQFADTSLISLGFVQPPASVYQLLTDSTKTGISKVINFNIDSVLLPENQYYQVEIPAIRTRIDSAISYTYDEQFNAVEKVVVNQVSEPDFNLTITGKKIHSIVNYWRSNNNLDTTEKGDWFTPMPLVKTYCKLPSDSLLIIQSGDYSTVQKNTSIEGLFFANIYLTNMPKEILGYLPADVITGTSNLESIRITGTSNGSQNILVNTVIKKKNNNQPLFK